MSLVLAAAKAWLSDGCSSLSAALAFWIALTWTPILLVVTRIARLFSHAEAVRMTLIAHAEALLDRDAATQIGTIFDQLAAAASCPDTVLSIGVAVFSATATLAGFGEPIRRIWRPSASVDPPQRRLVIRHVAFRLAALAILLLAGVALALLFVAEWLVAALAGSLTQAAIGGVLYWAGRRLATLLVLTTLYLCVIKIFAPSSLRWLAAWIGAAAAALLSVGSQQLLGQYWHHVPLPGAHAGLSTVMLLLLWIYCSVSSLLYGTELAAAWHCAMQSKSRRAILLSTPRRTG